MAEIIREVVAELRDRRLRGVGAAALVRYLQALGMNDGGVTEYLEKAFFLIRPPNINFLRRDPSGAFLDSALDNAFGPAIDATSAVWTAAGPYPDLIRRRDRQVFKAVARERDLIIYVRAANPYAERYIGREGFRPSPPELQASPRAAEPNVGLMASDPADPAQVSSLEANGFEIGSPAEGFIVRDRAGTAFYPGYILHGVYSAVTGMNAWTVADGENIRAALNRRLGEELIQCGPYDNRTQADAKGPQFPALVFHADGLAYVIPDAGYMRAEFKFRNIVGDV